MKREMRKSTTDSRTLKTIIGGLPPQLRELANQGEPRIETCPSGYSITFDPMKMGTGKFCPVAGMCQMTGGRCAHQEPTIANIRAMRGYQSTLPVEVQEAMLSPVTQTQFMALSKPAPTP